MRRTGRWRRSVALPVTFCPLAAKRSAMRDFRVSGGKDYDRSGASDPANLGRQRAVASAAIVRHGGGLFPRPDPSDEPGRAPAAKRRRPASRGPNGGGAGRRPRRLRGAVARLRTADQSRGAAARRGRGLCRRRRAGRAADDPPRPPNLRSGPLVRRMAANHRRPPRHRSAAAIGRQHAREVHAPLDFESAADERAAPVDAGPSAGGRVNEALASLPERQREAVRLLVLEEQSLSEAAAATLRSKGALKVNLHRALKTLRGRFSGTDGS